MGKRAREDRAAIKQMAHSLGYRETELGELRPTISKAEARRQRSPSLDGGCFIALTRQIL